MNNNNDHFPYELSSEEKIKYFNIKQQQPYDFKVQYAEIRAWEFYNECKKHNKNCHVSVGGLDSITLFIFLKHIGIDIPAISVSSLEDKSIQKIHKELGVINLKPNKSKVEILHEFGYPIISKTVAKNIAILQNPDTVNEATIDKIFNYGTGGEGYRALIPHQWMKLFGGTVPQGQALGYKIAPFKVSDKCCYYLKEQPCAQYSKTNNSMPYLGLMASEGGRRELILKIYGCNYFGKTRYRSAPFAIFNRNDLLQLALDLNVPIPEIYGEIKKDQYGNLYTTRAQRTGCSMCGFGIHLNERPHTFDWAWYNNQKEWEFYIYNEKWGEVLDYIGVEWRNPEKLDWNHYETLTHQQANNKLIAIIDNKNFYSLAEIGRYCNVTRQAAGLNRKRHNKTIGGKPVQWIYYDEK